MLCKRFPNSISATFRTRSGVFAVESLQRKNAAAHSAQLADCFDTAQLQEAVMNVSVLLIHLVSRFSDGTGSLGLVHLFWKLI